MCHDMSTYTAPARMLVQFRAAKTGIEKIDALAADLGVTRSDVIREALALALADPARVEDRIERKKQAL